METVVESLLQDSAFKPNPEKAFNGQMGRQALFKAIANKIAIEAIIETGTFLGETTGWMRYETALPIYSCEVNRHFHFAARRKHVATEEVYLNCDNSVNFLRQLSESNLVGLKCFFYLDAHWYESLPLTDELRTICANWKDFVVMVDDFEVQADSGYGFDDYGFRRALNFKCFRKLFSELKLTAFSPTLPSSSETGARSGCVVLASSESKTDIALRGLKELKVEQAYPG